MPAADPSLSAAVAVAWKIAAASARAAGQKIEPEHFLYGVFSLDRLPPDALAAADKAAAQAEIAALEQVLAGVELTFQQLRRSLRVVVTPAQQTVGSSGFARTASGPVNRSDAVKQAFAQAAEDNGTGTPYVSLQRLTCVLIAGSPEAAAWLGLTELQLRTLLAALDPQQAPDEPEVELHESDAQGMSIFQSLNADQVSEPVAAHGGVDWSRVGAPLGALCELAWKAGTSGRIEPVLEESLHILLSAVAAAEHAAILLQDESGDLLLKAHAPRGALPVTMSSAQKAIDRRESFIWQRGEDLSASQLESDLRAGLYAPILAAGEVFGVICLDANSAATRFFADDLYLVTALGHQLGLILANRRREEDLCRTARVMERLLTNFSPKVRERLLLKADAGRLEPGGERSALSVLCVSILNFPELLKEMETHSIVDMLNQYLSAMVSVIFRFEGSIDGFGGASLVAVFGSPEADFQHAEHSVRAALEVQAECQRISAARRQAGLRACEIATGVHTGEAIHGFVGSADWMEFTVLGMVVTRAGELSRAAVDGEILLSAETLEHVWKDAGVEEVQDRAGAAAPLYRLLKLRPARGAAR